MVTPALTQPASGESINVGTIAVDGTSVSKTITVKGTNLTKPLTVSVSGHGFHRHANHPERQVLSTTAQPSP